MEERPRLSSGAKVKLTARLEALRPQVALGRQLLASSFRDEHEPKENSEFHRLNGQQSANQSEVAALEGAIAYGEEVLPPQDGTIGLGSQIRLREDGAPEAFRLVSPIEVRLLSPEILLEGAIDIESPLGRQLLGHRVGYRYTCNGHSGQVVEVDGFTCPTKHQKAAKISPSAAPT